MMGAGISMGSGMVKEREPGPDLSQAVQVCCISPDEPDKSLRT